MKKGTIIFLLVGFYSVLWGQRFTFSPSNIIDLPYGENDFASNTIDIVNQTNEALTFKWRLISNTFPQAWSFSLCDLGGCYPSPPDSNTMSATSPGGNAFFICHAGFGGTPGIGSFRIFVFEEGDEANGDTVIFRYTAGTVAVEGPEDQGLSVSIFPNGADQYLNIDLREVSGSISVEWLQADGKPFRHDEFAGGIVRRVAVLDLANGIYLLRFSNRDGKYGLQRVLIRH